MALKQNAHETANTFGIASAFALLAVGVFALQIMAHALGPACLNGHRAQFRAGSICAEVANTPAAWEKGLSGRGFLPIGSGMAFRFPDIAPRTFWMKGMEFPLDMIWIRDARVIGLETHVVPDGGVRLIRTPPVDAVLELNVGEVERLGIRPGDTVVWATRK